MFDGDAAAGDAGTTGLPPGVMVSQPTGSNQLTALPLILSSDAAGVPVFVTASPQPAMFAPATPLTPLPSPIHAPPPPAALPSASGSMAVGGAPVTVKSSAMSLPLHAPPPSVAAAAVAAAAAHGGIFFQHFGADPPTSAPIVSDVTSPVFDFPMTSPGSEMCLQPPPHPPLHPAVNMTSYVH